MQKCQWPCCNRYQNTPYCYPHSRLQDKPSKAVKEQSGIAKRSERFKVEHRQYLKLVKEMLRQNNRCELCTPVCISTAQGLHHMKKRGANLLDKNFLKRSCNPCNGWVEMFPKKAVEMGLSLSKFH